MTEDEKEQLSLSHSSSQESLDPLQELLPAVDITPKVLQLVANKSRRSRASSCASSVESLDPLQAPLSTTDNNIMAPDEEKPTPVFEFRPSTPTGKRHRRQDVESPATPSRPVRKKVHQERQLLPSLTPKSSSHPVQPSRRSFASSSQCVDMADSPLTSLL